MKPNAYAPYGIQVAQALKSYLSTDELRELHRLKPAFHFAVVLRHVLLTVAVAVALEHFAEPWIWAPLALLQGFNILGFIILLHEQVHLAIFRKSRPGWMRVLRLSHRHFRNAVQDLAPGSS